MIVLLLVNEALDNHPSLSRALLEWWQQYHTQGNPVNLKICLSITCTISPNVGGCRINFDNEHNWKIWKFEVLLYHKTFIIWFPFILQSKILCIFPVLFQFFLYIFVTKWQYLYSTLCIIRTRKIHENWVQRERTDYNTEYTKAVPMGDNGGSVAKLH